MCNAFLYAGELITSDFPLVKSVIAATLPACPTLSRPLLPAKPVSSVVTA